MKSFEFDIVVGGIAIASDDDLLDISDALYEAGCDDGTVAAYNCTLYVSFAREADSYQHAVMSAITNIETVPNLTCISVDMGDVVGLADAAEKAGLTRAALTRYAKGQRGNGQFPTPILRVDSKRPLWSWGDIAQWLEKSGLVANDVVEHARETESINTALSIRRANSMAMVDQLFQALKNNRVAQ